MEMWILIIYILLMTLIDMLENTIVTNYELNLTK